MKHIKNRFAQFLMGIALLTAVATVVFALLNHIYRLDILLTLAISFGTTCYHFVMRLMVGAAVTSTIGKRLNWRSRWFQPRVFEKGLYRKLGVKGWKGKLPAYDPDQFDLTRHSLDEIVYNTCNAEVVHEVIMVFSFLPILFSLWWDCLPVFLITSVLSAVFDSLFVMIQRYNRPRLVRILERRR